MCNPLGQARALDQAGTELNLLLGLCVGHDSLFMRHSVAPVTVLAAKDRVLGHNPLAAIYMADGYYCDKLFPKADDADGRPAPDSFAGRTRRALSARPVYFASSRRSPRCRNVVSLTRSVQPPRVSTRRSNFST